MRLFLDTEFNGHRGDLTSMALVDSDSRYWYEVLDCKNPVPWVKDNVIPVLKKKSISFPKFQESLHNFLSTNYHEALIVIADWPVDIKYFCEVLITGDGSTCMDVGDLTFHVYRHLSTNKSKIPHNALEDAKALKTMYYGGR